MAKKGGTSEINGFIKSNDASKTKHRSSTRNLAGARSSRKDELDENNSKTKRVINKDTLETKSVNETNVTKVSKTTVNVTSKSKVSLEASGTSKTNSTYLRDEARKDRGVNKVKTTDNASKTKTSNQGINKTKATDISLKIRTSDQGITKVKSSDNSSKTRTSVEQVSSKRVSIQNGPKSKQLSSTGSQKVATQGSTTNKNVEKLQTVHSKDNKVKSIDNDKYNTERKTKREERRTEVSKDFRKTIEKDSRSSKNNVSTKSNIASKTTSELLKQKSTRIKKETSNEKERKNNEKKTILQEPSKKVTKISESIFSEMKLESPQKDLTTKTNYKDLIYFEVDMGNPTRPSSNSRVKSARIKSATSQPPPMSRQGTFTKDDSPTSLEPEPQKSEEVPVNEEPLIITDDNYEEVDYEDDFEDYESDFEEYISESESESGLSSKSETDSETLKIKPTNYQETTKPPVKISTKFVEEEKKLDSGNYDLSSKPVLPQSVKQKQLEQIREAISQENTSLFDKRKKTIPEETKNEVNKVAVLDFVSALKKKEDAKKSKKEKERSSIILQMIKLHEQTIDLFEDTFSDDDTFGDIYLNRNVSHAATETDVIMKEEEVQTDKVIMQNIWTQYPISYHPCSNSTFSFKVYLEDQMGYGGDNIKTGYNTWWNVKYSTKNLCNFIESASKVILIMLEEEARWRSDEQSVSIANPRDDLGFSDGCIPIQIDNISFLQDRPICDILFSHHDSNIFISSHRFISNIEKLSSFTDQFFGRSILCVWSILEPSQPLYLLVASCQICSMTFDLEYDNFIYAGLTDGSVCLWDLNESSMFHKETTAGSMNYLLRTPTFCTSHLAGKDYHHNIIVSMKSLGYENIERLSSQKFNPTQLLTLDSDGKAVLWIVTHALSYLERKEKNFEKVDTGMSFWAKFKLVMGRTILPESILPTSDNKWGLQCLCMTLAPMYEVENNPKLAIRSILVGTNIGKIVHFYISEDDIDVPIFSHESDDKYAFSVMCLESNPHGFPVFLAGCNDGKIRFYALDKPKPFKMVSLDEDFVYTPIIKIRWSPLGLGLYFALDKNFCLHFWDLCKGGYSPETSVSLKALQAAHFDVTSDNKFVYIALSVQRVKIDIYRLKSLFVTKNSEPEQAFFKRFVERNSNLLDSS